MTLRREEMIILDKAKTKRTANDIATVFMIEVVATMTGHMPKTIERVGFSEKMPAKKICFLESLFSLFSAIIFPFLLT
jgi:hypothetical protein